MQSAAANKRIAMAMLLQKKREQNGHSLKEGAKAMGLTPAYLGWLEKGGAPLDAQLSDALVKYLADANTEPLYRLITHKTLRDEDCFTAEEYRQCEDKRNAVLAMFEFDADKELYNDLLYYRCMDAQAPFEFIKRAFPSDQQYQTYINKNEIKVVLEGGVNDGFFTKQFLHFADVVVGFEPFFECWEESPIKPTIDPRRVHIFPQTLWRKKQKVLFWEDPNNSHCSKVIEDTEGKVGKEVFAISVDSFAEETDLKIDYIKLDTEGAEKPILEGALNTIQRDRPQLAISIYHSKEDMYEIPLMLRDELSDYVYRLGHYFIGHTETLLYAIPKEKVNWAYRSGT